MSGRRLVLLRHGRTAWNHSQRVQGQLDPGLDEEGLAQAERTAPRIAAFAPALTWCSDLTRARQTAAAVLAVTGSAATYDVRLREFSLGDREGLTHGEYRELAPEEFLLFSQGLYDTVPGAEKVTEVRDRMSSALHDLLDLLAPGETGLAVSHGAALRVATGALLGWPEDQFRSLRGLSNCGWVVLEEDPVGGRLRLGAYNATV